MGKKPGMCLEEDQKPSLDMAQSVDAIIGHN
jgi:hypothetical protein